MTKYYRFIVEDGEISLKSRFYKVKVGSSPADAKALAWLKQYASRKCYYLEVQCSESDHFCQCIADSLGVKLWRLPSMLISVSVLVRHIIATGQTPVIPPLSTDAAWFNQIVEPALKFKRQNRVIQHAEAQRRNKPKAQSVTLSVDDTPQNDRPSADGHQI